MTEKHAHQEKSAHPVADLTTASARLAGLVVCLIACSGCTTWSGGFPMSNPARVPPPGTGSYPQPANYYQNNGQGPLPTTSSATTGMPSAPANFPVQAASHQAPAGVSFQNGVRPASGMIPTNVNAFPANPAGNRYPSIDVPTAQDGTSANLQWQN